jgi:mannose-6-phosphate isomerase-like protein (cupin superfamily)
MQIVFTPQKDAEVGDLSLLVVNLYPHGGSTGLHIHAEGDEMIFIDSGYGEGVDGDKKFEIRPDTVLYAKQGVTHCITNHSDQTMRLICVFCPKMPDERVRLLTETATVKFKPI